MKKLWKKLCTVALAAVLTTSMVPMMAMGAEKIACWTSDSTKSSGGVNFTEPRGNFENQASYAWFWSRNAESGNELIEDPDGGYYFKAGANNYIYTNADVGEGRFKMTLRYKGAEGTAPWVALRSKSQLSGAGFRKEISAPVRRADTWEYYTLYFTWSKDYILLNDKTYDKGQYIHLGDVGCKTVGYYDDIVFETDTESDVEFVDAASFNDAPGNEDWLEVKTSSYRGTPIEKIDAAEITEDGYGVTAVGHYVPKTTEIETFNMVTAVYKVNKNNSAVMQLENVKITPGTASEGKAKTVSENVTVPAETADYTYEVKSFLWGSELTALQSLTEASTLSY